MIPKFYYGTLDKHLQQGDWIQDYPQKSVAFLNTNDNYTEKKKQIMPFWIASNNISLGNDNQTSYKLIWRKKLTMSEDGNISHAHGLVGPNNINGHHTKNKSINSK